MARSKVRGKTADSEIIEMFDGLVLKGVKETGEEFGVGAYGRVFAVEYYGTVCAAKEVHSILISGVGVEEFR